MGRAIFIRKRMIMMNYLKEINAFFKLQETNPVSLAAANLWHTLMHINNGIGWREKFSSPVSVLGYKASLSDSSFKRARTELVEKGYIVFESQGGRKAAIYQIISLVTSMMDHNPVRHQASNGDEEPTTGHDEVQKSNDLDHKAAPLYKQNKKKQNNTTAAHAINFFGENFEKGSDKTNREIMKWVGDISEPLVLLAMERALERNNPNWRYVKGILRDWKKKEIGTVEAARQEEAVFKLQKGSGKHWNDWPGQEEVVPDWFKELEQQRLAEQKAPVISEMTAAEKAREIAELEALLGKH